MLETMFRAGKPIALVCHAPGALRHVTTPTVNRRAKQSLYLSRPLEAGRFRRPL